LLKRQSEFLLPHQKGSFNMLTTLAGSDDCPGRPIPGGNYTTAAPYIDSGDTTGANNTVGSICGYYCYYSSDAAGPDHIYSFTLTARGANPRIFVTGTSATYNPIIYILDSRTGCPASTGDFASNLWWLNSFDNKTIFLDFAPLNVPLHLFVDANSAGASGPYGIRIEDVTIAPPPGPTPTPSPSPTPIDPEFFVRQHYVDFLNRQPDAAGLAFWANQVTSCGGDNQCVEIKQINVSAAFFLSIEFQETGYLVYRIYKAAYGNLPGAPVPIKLNEFLPDTQQIGQGVVVHQAGWEQILDNNKQTFISSFVQRSRFTSALPTSMTPTQFVDQLFANAEITPGPGGRSDAINEFGTATTTDDMSARARVLRRVAENATLAQAEFNRAFVLMQYFGYLRRNPNDPPEPTLDFQGYNFWLNKLNQFNGNFVDAEMVKAFITSSEYRQRFTP
jgi:hypothetical protein